MKIVLLGLHTGIEMLSAKFTHKAFVNLQRNKISITIAKDETKPICKGSKLHLNDFNYFLLYQ